MEYEFEPSNILPLDTRTQHGKVMGDYYRNLANNYYYYSLDSDHQHKLPWPAKPSF